jgi:CubicO group peptidase (beta-lactamase class C family)
VFPWGACVIVVMACLLLAGPASADGPWPDRDWERADPGQMGMDRALLESARDYALTGEGSGCIVRGGRIVLDWGDQARRYDLKSTTKSIGVTALGLAIADELLALEDLAADRHPAFCENTDVAEEGWTGAVTLRHLATHTAGLEKPGGYSRLVSEPGAQWAYSDCGPNWLAECVTMAYRRDLDELMFERVFGPIGITRDDLRWRDNAFRPHEIDGIARREFGSGIHANVQAMARIGLLYLRGGRWAGEQLVPSSFVDRARATDPAIADLPVREGDTHPGAPAHYGLLWWNNADGALEGVPRDAYWSWGLHESLIVVIPSLDLVIARAGSDWSREWTGHYAVLRPFLEPIVASVRTAVPHPNAPCPPSEAILGLGWAPQQEIVRLARGSDNWPITWGDDDALYTAYGDGWGFEPRVPEKLSLGLARVFGDPNDPAAPVRGENIRSETGEQRGDGRSGGKASGMLMIEGRLYMLMRNAGNSQLAWSDDRGVTWTWADWRFETSMGCPSFLNFGRDYSGARDRFVYVYSFDSDSAYEAADRMILARVPGDRLAEREAWEWFAGLDDESEPTWSAEIAERRAVFEHPGRCYRSGVTWSAPLGRYLWWQVVPGGPFGGSADVRFEGGFGVYEAPEPWGPWRTVYFTDRWDVGPGESGRFPTKWMSEDGSVVHLVFSGDDFFSIRKAELRRAEP